MKILLTSVAVVAALCAPFVFHSVDENGGVIIINGPRYGIIIGNGPSLGRAEEPAGIVMPSVRVVGGRLFR